MKSFHIKDNDISDGYHTFGELYDHRCMLFINLCLAHPTRCAWKEDEGTPGWVLLYWESPCGQVSYHVPERLLLTFCGEIKQNDNYTWDGHTSNDVLLRLRGAACK